MSTVGISLVSLAQSYAAEHRTWLDASVAFLMGLAFSARQISEAFLRVESVLCFDAGMRDDVVSISPQLVHARYHATSAVDRPGYRQGTCTGTRTALSRTVLAFSAVLVRCTGGYWVVEIKRM